MYACTHCDRSYTSQNSLTRHAHSHESSSKHQCNVCGLMFHRRDLLSRHSKLHQAAPSKGRHKSSTARAEHPGANLGRRRCHTACTSCRELRTRCDGHRPCGTCQRAGKPCTFSETQIRLSHVPVESHAITEMDVEYEASTELQEVGSNAQLPSEPIPDAGLTYDIVQAHEPFTVDMEAWPWMHENLYLPTNGYLFPDSTLLDSGSGPYSQPAIYGMNDLDLMNSSANLPLVQMSATINDSPSQVIKDLVAFASTPESRPRQSCAAFWTQTSTRLQTTFGITKPPSSNVSILHHFCGTYMEQFGPLWPLLSPQTLDLDALHPKLYLVLTSIGAMYCGPTASNYGAMMHTHIRNSLTASLDLEDDEDDLIWLAQARLLTQVAALYFGQSRAFTYAQHIGALLVAQARRMDLFSPRHIIGARRRFDEMKGIATDEERLKIWLQMESRRRLAFGIFRGDTYTSVLLHTKPFISLEEIDIQFPMCDAVWRADKMTPSLCIQLIENDQPLGRELRASDIFRIAMDRAEPLPPLDPVGHELLMFGLQYPIWRFARDKSVLEQLMSGDNITGQVSSSEQPRRRLSRNTAGRETHSIDSALRQMDDLHLEYDRLMSALRKWEHGLPVVKTFARTELDRSSLMSGLILYHLGFMRLEAPLEDLHQLQYRLADHRAIDDELIVSVRAWANTPQCRRTARRACNVWSMIAHEVQAPAHKAIKFNLLAFIGLHHAAVLLWSYVGGRDSARHTQADSDPLVLEGADPVAVDSEDQSTIFCSFTSLYHRITSGRWSSFAQAAEALARQQLPKPRCT